MKQFSIIGHPISHSLSPILHNKVFRELRLNAHFSSIDVHDIQLDKFIDEIKQHNLSGFNITLPHKNSILPLLDDINIKAQQINAVNCVVNKNEHLIGYNTDWYGFSMLLKKNNISIKDKTVIIIGAGGVAQAIVYSLLREGAGLINIVNRTYNNASKLINHFENDKLQIVPIDKIGAYLHQNVIIINCTSVGLMNSKNQSPFPYNLISENHTLIDTIYTPIKTQFLLDGETAGATTINGIDMFIYQAFASLNLWFGEPISNRVNFDKLKQYILGHLK
jgi:shikimate dehydrogenase